MLRTVLSALLLSASVAAAQSFDVSKSIAETGLTATEARLTADDPTTRFALGGVRFLRAIETTLQTRWRLGINADRTQLPIMRLPILTNPAPDPFTPDAITKLFATLITDLDDVRAPLLEIGDSDAVDLPITITDLWFDVNMNGTRDPAESVTDIGGLVMTGGPVTVIDAPVIHFDTADAAWLAAYTHFLTGFAQLVLAFDPTEAIARVNDSRAKLDLLAADTSYPNPVDIQFNRDMDRVAMVYFALRQQPDPAHTRAAHGAFLGMIAQNRVFWDRVARETDNLGEWVPNDSQQQALGLQVPEGTGARWQAVLADAEDLLNGTKLIPYWQLREGAGLNMKKLFENPVPVDLAEWLQGVGLLPFAEEGERVSTENWRAFERMLRGDTMLFVFFLN